MKIALSVFILIPMIGFILTLVIPKRHETVISKITFILIAAQLVLTQVYLFLWVIDGFQVYNIKEFIIYKTQGYELFIDLYFDKITAVYLFVGALLTFLVTTYSRYYLHRESGFKRFFVTVLFFYTGYNVTIFAGNFETLFIGWEFLGVSSFLLIAYYRDRYLPVKNAMKVYSLYRLGDVGMIVVMWMSHHLWHHNITFVELNDVNAVSVTLKGHVMMGALLAIIVSAVAAIKSAQFPFSSWLPRAMEGPTPSSAIFYSSLAVHIGAFLLMRTFPFWKDMYEVRAIVIVMGITSSILATFTARVQSTIKSQIAYSSSAQIGLIFVEIALGLDNLALIHFASNAFLRTYQLLVSPSVVTYLIREQFYQPLIKPKSQLPGWLTKIKNTIYVLSIREWNMDSGMFRWLWNPAKKLGRSMRFVNSVTVFTVVVPMYSLAVYFHFNQRIIPKSLLLYVPTILSIVGLALVLKAFVERKNAKLAWGLIAFNHFWIALAVSFNEKFSMWHNIIYLSGVVFSCIFGYVILLILENKDKRKVSLDRFYGHSYEYPLLSVLFFIACLGLAGFPITTTFLGEDLVFSHIHSDQLLLTFFISMSFVIDGIALIRIFARIFFGPHYKPYHVIAKRSS